MRAWTFKVALSAVAAMALASAAPVPGLAQTAPVSPPSASSGQKSCIEAGSDQGVVEGRLGLMEGIGPAAFIVTVPGGICLTGGEPQDRIDKALSVQLFSLTAEGYQDLYRMVGEKVYVRGKLTGKRSFQQRAPILMEVIEIATR
jgi:hypothetical protein